MRGAVQRLRGRSAETHPQAGDRGLRGRTYAIPFDRVWRAAETAASGGMARWRLTSADDRAGVLRAEVRTLLFRRTGDALIRIGLDDNGQTRVDMRLVMRGHRGDVGGSARIVRTFLKHLDGSLQARPDQILDPNRTPTWSS